MAGLYVRVMILETHKPWSMLRFLYLLQMYTQK